MYMEHPVPDLHCINTNMYKHTRSLLHDYYYIAIYLLSNIGKLFFLCNMENFNMKWMKMNKNIFFYWINKI